MPSASRYVVDLASYNGVRYVAAGAASEGKVYVYRNPASALDAKQVLVPVQILKVPGVASVSFSTNARFVVAENGTQFAVYDATTGKGYGYTLTQAIDAPQTAAMWMDGYHLDYVSEGKLTVFDFDGTNVQRLAPASAAYTPFFSPNYHTMFGIDATNALTQTALLTPADQ